MNKLALSQEGLSTYVKFLLSEPENCIMVFYRLLFNSKMENYGTIIKIGLLVLLITQKQKTSEHGEDKKNIKNGNKSDISGRLLCFKNHFNAALRKGDGWIFEKVGAVLSTIDPELAISCFKLYYSIAHNFESKYLLGQMLIDCNKKVDGANYLEQIDFKRYDLKALLLLCRTYYQLRYYLECLKGYLHLLDLDSGTSIYSIIAHY